MCVLSYSVRLFGDVTCDPYPLNKTLHTKIPVSFSLSFKEKKVERDEKERDANAGCVVRFLEMQFGQPPTQTTPDVT